LKSDENCLFVPARILFKTSGDKSCRSPTFNGIFEVHPESWQNGYCTGLEKRHPQGFGGSKEPFPPVIMQFDIPT
jgi:hypothetical protein